MVAPVATVVHAMAASSVGNLAVSSMPSAPYTAAAMAAKMALGPSWTSAMAGRLERVATTSAVAAPPNSANDAPAESAPAGAPGPSNTRVANDIANVKPPNATVAPTPTDRTKPPTESGNGGNDERLAFRESREVSPPEAEAKASAAAEAGERE